MAGLPWSAMIFYGALQEWPDYVGSALVDTPKADAEGCGPFTGSDRTDGRVQCGRGGAEVTGCRKIPNPVFVEVACGSSKMLSAPLRALMC